MEFQKQTHTVFKTKQVIYFTANSKFVYKSKQKKYILKFPIVNTIDTFLYS